MSKPILSASHVTDSVASSGVQVKARPEDKKDKEDGSLTPPEGSADNGRAQTNRHVRSVSATIPLAGIWLTIIVILPLIALTTTAFDGGISGFYAAISSPAALAAFRITLVVSAIVTVINAVFGTLVAWVLVRDNFPGRNVVNTIIDLPFALPTIVASLVLLSLYGPGSLVQINGTEPALVIALLFVTLPFSVRSVQPVLQEMDRDVEEAAACLGASNWTIAKSVVLPTILPAVLSGAGLSFARALGEYGSVVLIGGNIPGKTQVASQYIQQQIESDATGAAAAVSFVLLLATALILVLFRTISGLKNPNKGES